MKNDQKAHGWQFTAEVNHPFSRRTEALTHQSVLWNLNLAVHALNVYGLHFLKDIGSIFSIGIEGHFKDT